MNKSTRKRKKKNGGGGGGAEVEKLVRKEDRMGDKVGEDERAGGCLDAGRERMGKEK